MATESDPAPTPSREPSPTTDSAAAPAADAATPADPGTTPPPAADGPPAAAACTAAVLVPLACFRCAAEQEVPVARWRAGAVLRCPRCRAMIVVTGAMADAVQAVLDAAPTGPTDDAALRVRLRTAVAGLRPPGAPVPHRRFSAF